MIILQRNRFTRNSLTVPLNILLLTFLVLSSFGCRPTPNRNKKNSSTPSPEAVLSVPNSTQSNKKSATSKSPDKVAQETPISSREFATNFLTDLSNQSLKTEQIDSNFKKLIAPPKFADEVDFSELGAKSWFLNWCRYHYHIEKEIPGTNGFVAFLGTAQIKDGNGQTNASGAGSFALVLKKDLSKGSLFSINWFSVSKLYHGNWITSEANALSSKKEGALPSLTAVVFLDSLLGGDIALAAGLMSAESKRQLVTLNGSSETSSAFLQLKLKEYALNYPDYEIKNSTLTTEASGAGKYLIKVALKGKKTSLIDIEILIPPVGSPSSFGLAIVQNWHEAK